METQSIYDRIKPTTKGRIMEVIGIILITTSLAAMVKLYTIEREENSRFAEWLTTFGGVE